MIDRSAAIDEIVLIMRSSWDFPADCNEGELFAYAEVLVNRIRAGDSKEMLYSYLANVQGSELELPPSDAFRVIVDRSADLIAKSK
jgi:hypothetical protein